MKHIMETAYAICSPTGEIYGIHFGRGAADATAKEMAGKNKPAWPVKEVIITEKLPDIILSAAVDYFAKAETDYRKELDRVKADLDFAYRHKQHLGSDYWHGVDKARHRMIAAYRLVEAMTIEGEIRK